ncbi:DUF192 domain-containing protein [Nitrososphaera viennensis]|uniref:DUF192 domain-containing protein n=1 Tax=Nitrososphaera viennensis TaxID=1034015 RepID=A0A977ICZ3_9ARCH|nr:DUF192 domain-containing protein [Nitrososphaera viennensis]UVS68724.1 DUF192 domain-containing protein [Nitrososphaera viennensis]
MQATRLAIAIGAAAAAGIIAFAVLYFTPALRIVEGTTPNVPVASEGGLQGYNHTIVSIADVNLLADIADTPDKKTKGLAVRSSMTEGEGMLFVFDADYPHPFWMNGMKFPIDIIWLDSEKTVVHVEHSLPPCPNQFDCPNYQPDKNARYVLETVAGFSERHGVKEGTQAQFEL